MSEVAIVPDVARAAAEIFVEATAGAVAARERGVVALTGGSAASAFYTELRGPRWRSKVPWAGLWIAFSDERAVPPEHPESNAGRAERELFAHVPLAPAQIHRMRGEAAELDAEALRLAAELRALGTPPRFDVMLLGLGEDGHICSLFAGVPSSAERGDDLLVRHVAAPVHLDPRLPRLTLTPFLVVTARTVIVQVTGARKADPLARALKGPEDLLACPAQWLRKASGRVVIIADPAAAAKL